MKTNGRYIPHDKDEELLSVFVELALKCDVEVKSSCFLHQTWLQYVVGCPVKWRRNLLQNMGCVMAIYSQKTIEFSSENGEDCVQFK